jgi:phospholipid transport system substrate-binding protein
MNVQRCDSAVAADNRCVSCRSGMRAVAITFIQVLAWFAAAPGSVVAPAARAGPVTAAVSEAGPHEVMADLSARLFAALDKESAAIRHNADQILPLVDRLLAPRFDMEYAARLVLGAHWRSATAQQREKFAVALYQRLLRTYAGAVAGWTADRVKLLPLNSDPAALQVTVRTQVTNSDGAIVPVDFRLRQTAEGWKIFDVIVDGVSYVRIYHDDIDEEVTRKGLEAVIARLSRSEIGAAERGSTSNPPGAAK